MCTDDATWRQRHARFESDPLIRPDAMVFVFRGGAKEVSLTAEW